MAVNLDFFFAMQRTVAKIQEDQNRALAETAEAGSKVTAVVVHEDGRRFDKIHIAFLDLADTTKTTDRVAYFVERKTGRIYGPKTPLTPNTNWYFGTIWTSDMWDWSGEKGAKPLNEALAGVKKIGAYGEYAHYEPLTEQEKAEALAKQDAAVEAAAV